MKKLLFIPAILFGVFFTSCDDSENVPTDLVTDLDAETDASLEANYEDVDQIIDAGIETLGEGAGDRIYRSEIIECATVTKDTATKTVTIDYGEGCDANGRNIRGMVVIEYSDRRFVPGAYRKATLVDFYVDNAKVEGVRTLTNTSGSSEDFPEFTIELEGGKVTFADSTFATRSSNRTRTWVRASNPLNDEWQVTGTASGTRRDGITYTTEVTETLVHKRTCRPGVGIPVEGVKVITWDGNTAIIDYGDGSCDNVVTITINDGEPFDKVIRPRGRR